MVIKVKKLLLFIILCSVLISGCSESQTSQQAETGDHVYVNYTGTLDDGTVFDSSDFHGKPLDFIVGNGQMIQGFDKAVVGMSVGENKTIVIPPEDAYGPYCPELLIPIPAEVFKSANVTPIIGQKVTSQNLIGTIVNISETNVTIDCNNELAGKNLTFNIELVAVEKA